MLKIHSLFFPIYYLTNGARPLFSAALVLLTNAIKTVQATGTNYFFTANNNTHYALTTDGLMPWSAVDVNKLITTGACGISASVEGVLGPVIKNFCYESYRDSLDNYHADPTIILSAVNGTPAHITAQLQCVLTMLTEQCEDTLLKRIGEYILSALAAALKGILYFEAATCVLLLTGGLVVAVGQGCWYIIDPAAFCTPDELHEIGLTLIHKKKDLSASSYIDRIPTDHPHYKSDMLEYGFLLLDRMHYERAKEYFSKADDADAMMLAEKLMQNGNATPYEIAIMPLPVTQDARTTVPNNRTPLLHAPISQLSFFGRENANEHKENSAGTYPTYGSSS